MLCIRKNKKMPEKKVLALFFSGISCFIVPVENDVSFASCGKNRNPSESFFANGSPEDEILWRRGSGAADSLKKSLLHAEM